MSSGTRSALLSKAEKTLSGWNACLPKKIERHLNLVLKEIPVNESATGHAEGL
jgi:hypothetical protein